VDAVLRQNATARTGILKQEGEVAHFGRFVSRFLARQCADDGCRFMQHSPFRLQLVAPFGEHRASTGGYGVAESRRMAGTEVGRDEVHPARIHETACEMVSATIGRLGIASWLVATLRHAKLPASRARIATRRDLNGIEHYRHRRS